MDKIENSRRVEHFKDKIFRLSELASEHGQEESFQEIATVLEELQVAEEELLQQNEELAAARALLDAERQRYQNLFDFAPDGYLVTDPHGVVQEANLAFASLVQLEPERLAGKPLAVFVSLEDRPALRAWLAGISGQGLYQYEVRLQLESQEPFEAELRVQAVCEPAGQVTALRWLVRDITDRKQARLALMQAKAELQEMVAARTEALQRANRQLRESEERLRLALQAARMGVWEWELNSGLVYCSPEVAGLAGLPPGTLGNSYQSFLELVDPRDRFAVHRAAQRAVREEGNFDVEFRLAGQGQPKRWLASLGQVVNQPSGRGGRLVGVVMDVSERKQAETARLELLQQLERAQEEERRRISRELHDQVGQDLTALLLDLQAIKAATASQAEIRETVQKAQQIAEQVAAELHHLALQLRPTALDDLGLQTTLANLALEWSRRYHVQVEFHSFGLETVRLPPAIETTLYRVVQEALTNVVRHAAASQASVILDRRAEYVLAVVEDNGRGFEVETAGRAGGQAPKLGLVGMRERVAQAGGQFNVESAPGKGTTVFVRIPLAEGNEGNLNE